MKERRGKRERGDGERENETEGHIKSEKLRSRRTPIDSEYLKE